MRRRLLDLCLLAYPPSRRNRDREYLRDLAVELSETYGLRRQALSLLRGGLGERIRLQRLSVTNALTWARRAAIACVVLAAIGSAAWAASGKSSGDRRVEADRFVCSEADPSGCAETKVLVAARVREGWACRASRRATDGGRGVAWRCTLEGEPAGSRDL